MQQGQGGWEQAAFCSLCRWGAPSHTSACLCFPLNPRLTPALRTPDLAARNLRNSTHRIKPAWLLLPQVCPPPADSCLGTAAAMCQPQIVQTEGSQYLSKSRSYLSRFLSGESICWNFSLRSFPLSLYLPFMTERIK